MKKAICLMIIIGCGLIGYWSCSSSPNPQPKTPAYNEIVIELRSDASASLKMTMDVKVGDSKVGISDYEQLEDFIKQLEQDCRNQKISVPYIVDADPQVPMENISKVLEMLKSLGIKNIQFTGKLP